MPMALYKEIANEIEHNVGVICPIPVGKELYDEFENPTPLDADICWNMKIVKTTHPHERSRSMTELCFACSDRENDSIEKYLSY